MNYLELKRELGLKSTHLDTGFPVDFGFSKYEQPEYLPGKARDLGKLRAPAGEDLSHLNSPDFRAKQHFVRRPGSGRRAKK